MFGNKKNLFIEGFAIFLLVFSFLPTFSPFEFNSCRIVDKSTSILEIFSQGILRRGTRYASMPATDSETNSIGLYQYSDFESLQVDSSPNTTVDLTQKLEVSFVNLTDIFAEEEKIENDIPIRQILLEYKGESIDVEDDILAKYLPLSIEYDTSYFKERVFLELKLDQEQYQKTNLKYISYKFGNFYFYETIPYVEKDIRNLLSYSEFNQKQDVVQAKSFFVEIHVQLLSGDILSEGLKSNVLIVDIVKEVLRGVSTSEFNQKQYIFQEKSFFVKRYIQFLSGDVVLEGLQSDVLFADMISVVLRDISTPKEDVANVIVEDGFKTKEQLDSVDSRDDIKLADTKKRGQIQFSQRILPVRFVYLDSSGSIVKIWNNVQRDDEIYVLKFFDFESDIELEFDMSLMPMYSDILKDVDIFVQGYIYDVDRKNVLTVVQTDFSVDISLNFVIGDMSEVYTYM